MARWERKHSEVVHCTSHSGQRMLQEFGGQEEEHPREESEECALQAAVIVGDLHFLVDFDLSFLTG